MAKRIGWSTTTGGNEETRVSHRSMAAAYRCVLRDGIDYRAGRARISATLVWCDERDGHGWQLYERIEHGTEG